MNKKKPFQLFTTINALFTLLIGRFNWTSPPWIIFLRHQALDRPKQFWSCFIAIVLLILAGGYGYYWIQHLPKPRLITAVITPPKITPLQEGKLVPDVMTINFGLTTDNSFTPQSVAPLYLIGKEVTSNIQITPAIKGQWYWTSDSQLMFTPEEDWLAQQTYRIHFDKNAFALKEQFDRYDYTVSTQPFESNISELSFYQDPVKPNLKQVVATIHFNFPVDSTSLENHTTLAFEALDDGKSSLKKEPIQYTLTFDEHKRTAYLRSAPLSLPKISRYAGLTLNKGIKALHGSGCTTDAVSKTVLIPDPQSYFKVINTAASIVRNEHDSPEQILTLETSLGVTEQTLKKSLHVYLLPQNYPATLREEEKKDYVWENPGEVTETILKLSTPLPLQAIPADTHFAMLHSFKFMAQSPRYMYVKLDKGTRGFGHFELMNDFVMIINVPEYPKEIRFLHQGALIALNSEKKLSVLVRGLPAVKFNFSRVLPTNINQLVTQTQGDFNNPLFINQTFNQQNISDIATDIQQFDGSDLTKQRYTALDFSKYFTKNLSGDGPQGLFFLEATGWDTVQNTPLDAKASRLILITDLGLLVKDNHDGSHDVFVQSITQGTPLANVQVSVLGKNGLPLLTYTTDTNGRVNFPRLNDFIDDREPVVYIARLANDVSFIPYNNSNRQLNYSRFDVGGLYSGEDDQHHLTAYLFSDRGIYRPGDQIHVGMIVKQAYAQPSPPGVLLEAIVTDPRGTSVFDEKFTLDSTGYLSFDLPTQATSPTGQYWINLYIVKDKHPDNLLGSTSIRVAEFQPDRMRIKSSFSNPKTEGWVNPDGLTASIQLINLYGAPAADRRVSGKLLLVPQAVTFKKYPDYRFIDPLVDPQKTQKHFTESLMDEKTNAEGEATFHLGLNRFDKATYQLTFFSEGFEGEGGRSVATQSSILVSPLPYFVGFKADGDLKFIKQNDPRSVHFIAIDPQLNSVDLPDLTLQLVALHHVNTLVKKPNGTFEYQSMVQSKVLSNQPFRIKKDGMPFEIPSTTIGDFAILLVDKNSTEISRFNFSVVGKSQLSLSKNAELTVKLNKDEYKKGEDIELQIMAPYTGAGLITIERDKVYASQWFKTDMTSSVQRIHIPDNFQGNGYVNVSFVRDWNSPDIYMSPLSYAVVPFNVDNAHHAMHVLLDTPEQAKPGEPFVIHYQTDKPGKIIVFAVDEGVLQVTRYVTPDPLSFFFQKRALDVLTQQTLDQILPQYILERELSAVGGDAGEALLASHLNPFKRKTEAPVVYWSGLLDTDGTLHQITYDLPDYFNGSLRIMAVAVGADTVGFAEKQSKILGNFVINPNVPTFVAPGDRFDVTATIANHVSHSGETALVSVELNAHSGLQMVGSNQDSLIIPEGQEKTVRFKLKATSELGSAALTFITRLGDKSSRIEQTLSVRPASAYSTTITNGLSKERTKSIPILRELYPEYRHVTAAVSTSPLMFVVGLEQYLNNFPFGCTEQLTSKALPLLAMTNQPWFEPDIETIHDKVKASIQAINQRQMSDGGFSYWPGSGGDNTLFASVYALHFLTEAKDLGYYVPTDTLNRGLAFLRDVAQKNVTDLDMARLQAYAIYILTRNEVVTTNYLTHLQSNLDQLNNKAWKHDITLAYMASTYQLLKSFSEANRLMDTFKLDTSPSVMTDFYSQPIAEAQYLYLVEKHFPERLSTLVRTLLPELITAINSDEINTVLSAYVSLALSGYDKSISSDSAGFSIVGQYADNKTTILSQPNGHYGKVGLDDTIKDVLFNNPNQKPFFYQLIEAGFDKQTDSKASQNGLEIYREYRDTQGNVIDKITMGSEIVVHIQIRGLTDHDLTNIAITDLLPGGFEVLPNSISMDGVDYADVREDRVVFFTSVNATAKALTYRIKATNIGHYEVPAILAESMYHPSINTHGVKTSIEVTGSEDSAFQ